MILRLVALTLAIIVGSYILPGIAIADYPTAIIFAITLGVLNTFLRPIISIFTLPITLITLGLFSLVINALLVILASYIVPGVQISSFLDAVIFCVVISLVTSFLNMLTK